jgi:hypothetical protein
MPLTAGSKGRIAKPPRVVLYGVEKIGKSSFAAGAPSPRFICSEDGTSELDVERFREPRYWEEVRYCIDTLCRDPHDYKTVILDTLDWLEPLCWREVCRAGSVPALEDYGGGYGKGYDAARDVWRALLDDLDELRDKRGMAVVLLAHSWIKSFKNPEGDDYDRYEMKLHQKSSKLIMEWADCVLFATYETFTKKGKSDKKAKGVASGARVIHTQRTAAWDAGNRYDLPETLPLDWDAFAEAMKARAPEEPAKLKDRIGQMLDGVKDKDLHARVTAAVAKVGDDAAQLARIANKLAATVEGKD